jgi:hypothetical protein
MNKRLRYLLISFSAAACASNTIPDSPVVQGACIDSSRVETSEWKEVRNSVYSHRIPPWFQLQPDQSVDSDVTEWKTSDNRRVLSDYGFWNGPFTPSIRLTDVAVCQASSDNKPQIVTFRTPDGVGAGLYWIVPGGPSKQVGPTHHSPLAMWISAESPNPHDLPELLAIVRSVRLHDPK